MEYLSQEKYAELEEELKDLKTNKRKEIAESLEYAKSLGDLSENAEYLQAREEQVNIEERISKIEEILKSATVVSRRHSSTVDVGSTVIVEKEGSRDRKTYHIVGSEEADMAEGKVSNASPLGSALYGKKKGETVSVTSPKGVSAYTIIDVQ